MSKMGAAALLVMAAFAGSASAQSAADCAPQLGADSRCHGPKDEEKKACCPGLVCMQKDEWYGQCKPEGSAVPDGWDGTVVDYGEGAPVDAPTGDDIVEAPVEAPLVITPAAPLGDVTYMAVIAKDYIPNAVVPNLVPLEDITPVEVAGNVVTDQQMCEDLCTATEGCNAASYYLDASLFDTAGRNCWLKIIGDSCELPSDALDDANAVLLLQIDETCGDLGAALGPAGAFADGPDGAMGPDSLADGPLGMLEDAAPRGIELDDGTLDEPSIDVPTTPQAGVTGVTGGPTSTTVPPAASSAPVGARGVMMAVAVAVAMIAAF